MEKIKVGVIGVGNMGKKHVQAYAALKHLCQLVGVYDIRQGVSQEVARGFGIKSFTSLEELLQEIDAVNIATPTTTHARIALKALDNGLHVLLEKPITGLVEEAQRLLEVAKKRDLILQVGHIERFNPAIRALPEVLEDEEIIALDVRRMGPYPPQISDTDVIQDLMIHDIDVVSSLANSTIEKISAFARRVKSEKHMDYAVANLIMEDGIIATLTASRASQKKVRKMAITTHSSYIELDFLQQKVVVTHKGLIQDKGEYQQELEQEDALVEDRDPLKTQLTHFINSIEDHVQPLITGADGLEALKLTRLIQKQVYQQSYIQQEITSS
ncbi:MAG: Gfo/Idh/MocA family oxidoreductase [Bacillota bacterium]